MNLFQQLTVGGLSVLVLAMASSVSANACDKNEEVKNPNPTEVTCKTTVKIKRGERTETTTCKTNKEWKEQSRGCGMDLSYLKQYKENTVLGGR